MNIKILTATVLVVSFSLWALSRDQTVDTGTPQLARSELSAPLAQPAVLLGGPAPARERDLLTAPATPPTPGATATFSFAMEFDVRDALGDPFEVVDVQIAPSDHSFVTVGTTDTSGHLRVEWEARVSTMTVDVALVSNGIDLIGVQRVDVHAGRLREVAACVPRGGPGVYFARTLTAHRTTLSLIEGRIAFSDGGPNTPVEAPHPQRRRPRRGAPGTVDGDTGGSVTFGTDLEGVQTLGTSILGGGTIVYASLNVSGRILFEDDLAQNVPKEKDAAVEGFVGDEYGRPAVGYPVRFVLPGAEGRVSHVLTDDEGRYRIESRPGKLRCFVGVGRTRVQWERELASGEIAGWNPKVERKNDLLLHVSGPTGHELEGMIVQARIDNGRRLWVGRGTVDEDHRATILGCPSTTLDIELIAPGSDAKLPFLRVPDIPTGDVWEQAIAKESLATLPVRCTPDDLERPASSASELLIFDESRTWGTRRRIRGEVGSALSMALPTGTWWLEIGTRETGRTEIGAVHVVGDQPVELGTVPLEPLGEISFPPDLGAGVTVEIHHIRRDVDSCVATRSPELEPAERSKPLPVRPGLYRVTLVGPDDELSATTFEVRDGEQVSIKP